MNIYQRCTQQCHRSGIARMAKLPGHWGSGSFCTNCGSWVMHPQNFWASRVASGPVLEPTHKMQQVTHWFFALMWVCMLVGMQYLLNCCKGVPLIIWWSYTWPIFSYKSQLTQCQWIVSKVHCTAKALLAVVSCITLIHIILLPIVTLTIDGGVVLYRPCFNMFVKVKLLMLHHVMKWVMNNVATSIEVTMVYTLDVDIICNYRDRKSCQSSVSITITTTHAMART